MIVDIGWTHLACTKLIVDLEVNKYPHMMPSEMSCMPLFERLVTLYEENTGMLLCHEFHYKLVFT